jgi:hypothetical protein
MRALSPRRRSSLAAGFFVSWSYRVARSVRAARTWRLCILAGSLSLMPSLNSVAHAFSSVTTYSDDAANGGGGGRWFTGSPAEGYDCSVCHTSHIAYSFPLYQTGLPLNGYVPGVAYTVRLTWPEAADAEQKNKAAGLRPLTSLNAEFLAEDGEGSGITEVQPEFAMPNENCDAQVGAASVYAASVFQTSGDSATSTNSCTASETGQRCLVTLQACGAQALRVRWTAPDQYHGPIWFSAGFVTTYDASSEPNDDDYVTALSIPMNTASQGPPYQNTLDGGCTISGAAMTGRRDTMPGRWLSWVGMLSALMVRRLRRRSTTAQRRSLSLGLCSAFIALGVGCSDSTADNVDNKVGLYTPGYKLGTSVEGVTGTSGSSGVADAGPNAFAGAAANCDNLVVEADAGVSPPGSLSITFTTTAMHGAFDLGSPQPFENYGMVWIEDPAGSYVTGLSRWGVRWPMQLPGYLFDHKRYVCKESPDVVTTATLHMHTSHQVTWNGTNLQGDVVPDGPYKLWIEVEIDETEDPHQPLATFDFIKGRDGWTQTFPAMADVASATLTYSPQ